MAYQIPPVLFLIFSRPSTTEVVFEEIRKAKPKKLFIAADGPRKGSPARMKNVRPHGLLPQKSIGTARSRPYFATKILDVGGDQRERSSWFFEHVEEGIILEDDIKPAPEFFRFCAEMLERYRDETRVMEIAGSSLPNQFYEKLAILLLLFRLG